MKAKDGVIDHLNNLLTIELTAINQYFIHAEMCQNWGFDRLYKSLSTIFGLARIHRSDDLFRISRIHRSDGPWRCHQG